MKEIYKYPTLSELFNLYRKGELVERNYICRHPMDEDKPTIWIPWSEIVAGVILSDELNKAQMEALWGGK